MKISVHSYCESPSAGVPFGFDVGNLAARQVLLIRNFFFEVL